MLYIIEILQNFPKLKGKHLCRSLVFNNCSPVTLFKYSNELLEIILALFFNHVVVNQPVTKVSFFFLTSSNRPGNSCWTEIVNVAAGQKVST